MVSASSGHNGIINVSIMKKLALNSSGLTLAELTVSIVILVTFTIGLMGAYFIMVGSAATARMKSAGLSVATEQLEYLRSLPYDQLAIQGGAINSSYTKLPATKNQTVGPYTFVVTTNINYADDAYDGCLVYTTATSYLCRNGPVKSGTPVDSNPKDYKLIDVIVKEKNSSNEVSRVSTEVAARVAETGGGTGALVVTVVDSTGQVIAGATVNISDTTVNPSVNQTITTDVNGVAAFLDVTPDSGKDYVITSSKSGYSTLGTIGVSGSLSPTYPNVSVLSQQVTSATMKIDPIATDSLLVKIVDTNGTAQPGARFSLKGGVKLYTSLSDQSYGYDQTAITTDSSGQYLFHGLTPGQYTACYSNSLCQSGRYLISSSSTYGANSLQPFTVDPGTVNQSGGLPMQTIVLVTSSSSSYPRIATVSPTSISATSGSLSNVQLTITGSNLSNAAAVLRQSGVDVAGVVTGTNTSTSIRRQFDLSGKSGSWELILTTVNGVVSQNGQAPGTLGGFNVTP